MILEAQNSADQHNAGIEKVMQVGGLTTTLDIAALASALIWPFVVVLVAFLFRDRVIEAAKMLMPRLKSVSIGTVSFEFAVAKPLPMPISGAVDVRHAGQSSDIDDSTLGSFYEQIRDPSRLDYAIVDLGEGHEWLTSRLFILSEILSRMRGLKVLVFVETAGYVRRHFVGVCTCQQVRWRLAARFPWLECALTHAEYQIWSPPPPESWQRPRITNAEGRLEWSNNDPEPAAKLLRAYLDIVQRSGTVLDAEWVALPSSPQKIGPQKIEHARWLSPRELEDILSFSLERASVDLTQLLIGSDVAKARLLFVSEGEWLAVTRQDGVFDRLINRRQILEAVARQCIKSLET
jgi:hypothetical protein